MTVDMDRACPHPVLALQTAGAKIEGEDGSPDRWALAITAYCATCSELFSFDDDLRLNHDGLNMSIGVRPVSSHLLPS